MRTTLTLDPDVERLLAEEVHRVRRPFKQVVNDAIRRGLSPRLAEAPVAPYRLKPHRSTLAPGVDASALNRLADELEDDAILAKRRARRR
ncbi:MAG TPA: antitoxin [Polyangia bacterium]|nr:antitoxin [Polyangia bacterium]